jgi:transposase
MARDLMSDEEWAVFEPFLMCSTGRPPKAHRRKLDGVFWIARTGAGWRDLPAEFGHWNSVWKQFRRWACSGVFDIMLEGFADSGGDADGMPIAVEATPGEAHDVTAYDDLMEQRDSDPGALLADKGHDSDAIRKDLRDRGASPEIPTKSNRLVKYSVFKPLYACAPGSSTASDT